MLRRKISLALLLLASSSAHLAAQPSWPLFNVQPINTHWESWNYRFIALDGKRRLVAYDLQSGQQSTLLDKPLQSYPDVLKHFPLKDGDLVVAVFRQTGQVRFMAFDANGKSVFDRSHNVPFRILEADVRLNERGLPTCLFYSERKNNYVISRWEGDQNRDLFLSEEPIEKMVMSWRDQSIHVINRTRNELNWMKWKDGNVKTYRLPFFISHPTFFVWQEILYLTGIDIKGNIWRFNIAGKKVRKQKIIGNVKFRMVDKIVTTVLNKNLVLLLPSSKTNSVWKIVIADLGGNELAADPEQRKLFWASEIHPVLVNGDLNLLLETELGHLYYESWKPRKPYIYDIKWKVKAKKGPPRLKITWKSRPPPGEVAYSYLLDHKKNSRPLPDFKIFEKNKVTFDRPSEGFYGFHLQLAKPGSVIATATYHIPILWRYHPETPRIVLLKELGPRLVAPGKLEFFIENLAPVKYYAEINDIPKYAPKKKLSVKKGFSKIKKKLKPGRYYLHVRARDKRSGLFGPTNHFLFFVDPYNPEQDETLADSNRKLSEVEYILKKIRENRDNPKELKKWVRRLRELQQKVK